MLRRVRNSGVVKREWNEVEQLLELWLQGFQARVAGERRVDLMAQGGGPLKSGPSPIAQGADGHRCLLRRRGTSLPAALPLGLSDAFAGDATKRRQWDAFVRRNQLQAPALDVVVKELGNFALEPLARARGERA